MKCPNCGSDDVSEMSEVCGVIYLEKRTPTEIWLCFECGEEWNSERGN
jgi:ribosomal protein L37AE/L43A